ncbi:peroxide stress protein YaaA [Streptococcus sp. zg-JUN1979]|uniref:peroxide stress protein YaaA n=1 Tax=Streptococcus sp. zg-JUN1979 TaxID=3391450 RepID=UPI0039A557B3
MIFLLPTAKEMTDTAEPIGIDLEPKTQTIVDEMASRTISELATSYHISDAQATTEAERWQELQKKRAPLKKALHLFNGLMYRHIHRSDLTPDEETYIKERLYITSSLYGIIPAYQLISPHRLDFNTKIRIHNQTLKSYWRTSYDAFLKDHKLVISLLSSEFEQVFSPALRQNLIRVTFMESHGGNLKNHSTISKKARGQFFSQAANHNVQTMDELKQLSWQGFCYRNDLSTEQELVFVKEKH